MVRRGPFALGCWMAWLTTLLLVAPPAQAENQCSNYGICAHLPSNEGLDLIKAAGFDWIRLDFNWFQLEPQNNNFNWAVTDGVVNKAHQLGLNMFVTLSYTPQWASSVPGCAQGQGGEAGCNCQPFTSVAEWQDFVTKVVDRYKDKIKHWGMWNEPNLDHFYCGTEDQYVYEILIPGAAACKAEDPACVVLGPELAGLGKSDAWNGDEGTCVFGECWLNGWEISLANILDKGGEHIDVITHHFYTDSPDELAAAVLDGEYLVIKTHSSLKEIVQEHGQGQPVWLTEWGWETKKYPPYTEGGGDYTDQEQAAYLPGFFELRDQIAAGTYGDSENDPWPQLTKLFSYDYHDGADGAGKLWSFGIVYADGSLKPAYTALQDWFAAHPPGCNTSSVAPEISGLPTVMLEQGETKPHAIDLLAFTSDPDTEDGQLQFSVVGADPFDLGLSVQDGHWLSVIPTGSYVGAGTGIVEVSDGATSDQAEVEIQVVPFNPLPPYGAPKINGVVIDGQVDAAWQDAPEIYLTSPDDWVGLVAGSPDTTDLSMSFRILWDAEGIVILLNLRDDIWVSDFPSDQMWLGDSVQVGIDGAYDQEGPGYDDDDWEVGLTEHGGLPVVYNWHKPLVQPDAPIDFAVGQDGPVRIWEARIPGEFPATVGLSLLVNENDGDGREGWLQWTPGIGLGKDTSLFATVNLLDGPVPPVDTGPGVDTPWVDVITPPDDTGPGEETIAPADLGGGDQGTPQVEVTGEGTTQGDGPPGWVVDTDSPEYTWDAGSGGCAAAPIPARGLLWLIVLAAAVLGLRRRRIPR